MPSNFQKTLMEMLVGSKRLTQAQLDSALARQRKTGENLSKILVSAGLIQPQDLMATLSRALNIPAIDLAKYRPDPEVAHLIPERLGRQYHAVPISKLGKRLTVAMADPMNIFAIDDLTLLTHYEVVPVLSNERDIQALLDGLYGKSPAAETAVTETESGATTPAATRPEEEVLDLSDVEATGAQAPVVKVVDAMISEALKRRASDIHVEPGERDLRIRYRVDGSLQEAFRLPKKYQNALVARLKILSKLDITEWRLPQDGRFRVRYQQREVDFRVSVLPIAHGSKVVLRILDRRNLAPNLDALGFLPSSLKAFKDASSRPYGMILVTGPTGSGKSTTLYSVLSQLNTPDRNIVTIEDPVEYQVSGITQIQAHPEIGLTFAAGLRSLLRQNPDVIMIGEIRDGETADIAIKSSLTGHLVLSTLHTNDAPSAITRLVDMGVEPFLIASSVVLVAAQRLCRQLCARCRVPSEVPPEVLERLGYSATELRRRTGDQEVRWFAPKGCPRCAQQGYYGRFGILETMVVDETLREMIADQASSEALRTYAVGRGMRTLRQEGLEHAMAGRTSLEEVLHVTAEG